jgi:hypothetical protein
LWDFYKRKSVDVSGSSAVGGLAAGGYSNISSSDKKTKIRVNTIPKSAELNSQEMSKR